MTEAEWLACADPQQMLSFVQGRAIDRKLRLFACACCRRIWHRLPDLGSRAAVESAERFADGIGSRADLQTAGARARTASLARGWARPGDPSEHTFLAAGDTTYPSAEGAAASCVVDAAWWATSPFDEEALASEGQAHCKLLRDVFGNPFRPVTFDRRWRTADTSGLATGIYEDRAFNRLPLLADALMDAGCGDEHLLAHCRSDGPHVRGCFAVDLVLGKE